MGNREGYGCALLKKPELVQDMITMARNASNLPVSIKIRVMNDFRLTEELVKRAEKMGVSLITVHGRKPDQRSTAPVSYEAVKMIGERDCHCSHFR